MLGQKKQRVLNTKSAQNVVILQTKLWKAERMVSDYKMKKGMNGVETAYIHGAYTQLFLEIQ